MVMSRIRRVACYTCVVAAVLLLPEVSFKFKKLFSGGSTLKVQRSTSLCETPTGHIPLYVENGRRLEPLDEAFMQAADSLQRLIVCSVDAGYAEMAVNLYLSSFVPLNISNYLMVAWDNESANALQKASISFYLDMRNNSNTTLGSSLYGSAEFNKKMQRRTRLIYRALKLNISTLLVDLDITFFDNPFNYFHCDECDVHIQDDSGSVNGGFYFIKPTVAGLLLLENVFKAFKKFPAISDQTAMNNIQKSMAMKKELRIKVLPLTTFPNGLIYFEKGQRAFSADNPCSECVIIHNNWIVSMEAKRYRFKEHLLWNIDTNGYYTDQNRLYMTYSHPSNNSTPKLELETLRKALSLSYLLNRTLIFPNFTCPSSCKNQICSSHKKRCPFNSIGRVSSLDKHFGTNSYREHVFLKHPLVPASVKENVGDWIRVTINNSSMIEHLRKNYEQIQILRLYSLNDANISPPTAAWENKLKVGVVKAGYRQF